MDVGLTILVKKTYLLSKFELQEKFTETSDPIVDLGIGGIRLAEEIAEIIKKFDLYDLKQIKSNEKIKHYWIQRLNDLFLGRSVIGIFAKGNEDSWGAFAKYTTPEVIRIEVLFDDPLTLDNNYLSTLDFALVVNDPGNWRSTLEHELKNPDETWYYYSFGDMTKNISFTSKEKYTLYTK